jgi:hypothetical protein
MSPMTPTPEQEAKPDKPERFLLADEALWALKEWAGGLR